MVRIGPSGDILPDSAPRPRQRGSGIGTIHGAASSSGSATSSGGGIATIRPQAAGSTGRTTKGVGTVRGQEAAGGTRRDGTVGTLRHNHDEGQAQLSQQGSVGEGLSTDGSLGGLGGAEGAPFNLGRLLGSGAEPLFTTPAVSIGGFDVAALPVTIEMVLIGALVYVLGGPQVFLALAALWVLAQLSRGQGAAINAAADRAQAASAIGRGERLGGGAQRLGGNGYD